MVHLRDLGSTPTGSLALDRLTHHEISNFLLLVPAVFPLISLGLLPSVHVSSQIPVFKVQIVSDVIIFLIVLI